MIWAGAGLAEQWLGKASSSRWSLGWDLNDGRDQPPRPGGRWFKAEAAAGQLGGGDGAAPACSRPRLAGAEGGEGGPVKGCGDPAGLRILF